jgi:hypothetical protein
MSAKLDRMKQLIDDLGNASGVTIPGLDSDSVINNLASKNPQLQDAINQAPTEAEKKAILDRYKNELRSYVNEQIAIIKITYAAVKDGTKQIAETVTALLAQTVLPPGIGPVTPNPAFILLEGKQKSNILKGSLSVLVNAYRQLLQAALNIQFELPDVVLSVGDSLSAAQRALNTIPV